jgi:glycosyltransferase involved in cell wall biosynthesis
MLLQTQPLAPPRRLRALLVPDYAQWVLGTMASAIARHNPWLDPLICPANVVGTLLFENGRLPFDVDLVHIFSEWDALRLGKHFLGKVPVVNAIHHVEKWEDYRPLLQGDAVQVVSDQWRRHIIEQGADADQLVLLPNGIDTEMFAPLPPARRDKLRRSLGISPSSFTVGMFSKRSSNSSGRKAPHVFIDGLMKLAPAVPGLTAVIVGPGWGDVVKTLADKGVRSIWRPFIPDRAGVAQMYQCLDAYWVTSRIEGGPVPLLEAMACGACCVSTPVGVVPELLRDGDNAFVVGFDDAAAFADRTQRLASDPDLVQRMSHSARQTITSGVQWSQTAPRAVELYDRAIRRFAQRGGGERVYDVPAAARYFTEPEPHPRADLPAQLKARLASLEQFDWVRELLNMDERGAACRAAARALMHTPLDGELWGNMLRNLLPEKLVALLKRGRRMVRSSSNNVTGTST